jgi:hypothetical protein
MTFLHAIARLFRGKPKGKTDYDIVSVTLYNPDGSYTPVDASLAGRCGYVRERLRESADSSAVSSNQG